MTALKIDAFLRALEGSNLLPPDLVARVKRRVAEGKPGVDPRSVAKWLVEKEYLTLWQANKLLAGRTAFYLGRYKLLDSIGKGGMGIVFKAQHAVMDRVVALKIMNPDLLDKPQAVARFNREVKTAAALNHPNIITAHDADSVGRTHFLVMEFVDGQDLNQWLLARGPMPISAACEFAMQSAVGLGHAYGKGMVHRDIKPVNLLLTWSQELDRPLVKILDLGLARFVSETQEDGGLTRMGQTIGTPDYIAPEAAENFKQADIRADIFSLGCSLFKLLTGRLPFGGNNTMEKLLARANKPAPLVRLLRPDVSPELEAVVAKMLATNPADRYQTPAEVAAALAPFAATTLGDRAALELFHGTPAPSQPTAEALEAEADASLEEFFRDFAVAPLREDGAPPTPAPTPRKADSEDIGLAPLDDDPPHLRPSAPVPDFGGNPKDSSPAVAKAGHQEAARATSSNVPGDKPAPASSQTPPAAPPIQEEPARKKAAAIKLKSLPEARDAAFPPQVVADPQLKPGAARRPLRKTSTESVWESPLLMYSGAAVVLLVLIVGGLLWATYHQGSAALLTLANDTYRNGSYPQALKEYENFIKEFPHDEQVGFARARQGLIQIRQAAESKGDWLSAAEVASKILPEISTEEKFKEVQEEVASLLPTIAEGLAKQAGEKQDTKCIDQAQAMLELVSRYVPKDLQSAQRLQNIAATLDVTTRQLARLASLNETIAAMQKATQSGETASAYQARATLLKTYPDLVTDEKLQTAIREVAQAEQAKVVAITDLPKPQSGEPASPVVSTVSFAAAKSVKPVKVDTTVVVALHGGSVWGLDSASGKLLWRRHVGFDVDWLPQAASPATDSDWILTDAQRKEVMRVGRTSGDIVWRSNLGDTPIAAGCQLADRVVIPTASGRLGWFNTEDGATTSALQIPQPLSVAPVTDRRQRHLYQFADHSNLYVLAPKGDKCEEVFYLGHEIGTIAAPPVLAGRYLIVVENNRVDNSTLRVLLTDEQGLGIKQIQELPLEGHVQTPPVVDERSLYVVTDRGAMYLFEIGTPDKPAPLAQLIALPATSATHRPHYFAVRGDKLWVGAEQLTSYSVQAARGRFTPDWVQHQKEICAQALQTSAGQLFYGSIRPGFDGISVSCLDTSGAGAWSSILGSPLAGGPIVAGEHIWALSSAGSLFAADAARRDERTVNPDASATLDVTAELAIGAAPVVVPPGKLAFVAPATPEQMALADVSDGSLAWLKLPDALVGDAAEFARGLLVPGRGGQVALLDPATGKQRLAPFQPPQRGGEQFNWSAPLVIDERQFVIADGHSKLYCVEIQERPKPHLAALSEADTTTPIVSPIGILGEQVYAATTGGKLRRFRLPTLDPLEPLSLEGNVVLGPRRVGNQLLLATDQDRLLCINPDGTVRWTIPLPYGPLAGLPIEDNGTLLAASTSGKVWRLDPQTGAEKARIDLLESLAAGPVADGKRLLLAAADGSILVILAP